MNNTTTQTTQREDAKKALFEALKNNNGDTKNETVVAAIERLASLNPQSAPTENLDLLKGDWLLINAPNFPNRQPDSQGRYIYTLGRLAFNMFEPVELLVEIERVLQPVFPTGEGDELTHDIIVEFKTIDENFPELKGIVKNLAVCSPKSQDTVQVQFTGGELIPLDTDDPSKMKQWLKVFGDKSDKSQLSWRQRLTSGFIKWMFGISKASEINSQTGKRVFTMKKSPKGVLKLLYLDDELRITKGNRGTVLVCQRQVEPN
ncbi:MAG: PAP/fibrillin family protein [Pleurocapsa sp. MO_226.B13]|nr:PAP/fibrillin family protein [Pleurocapsa sp. MO_226.B13]